MIRRARMIGVLAFLLAGTIGIISSTQTWLVVHRTDGGENLSVAGADAMALLAPLSLAVLALGAALSIAGRVLRYVFGALGAAGAIVLIVNTLPLAVDPPLAAAAGAVAEVTGLTGDDALHEVIATLAPTAWPMIALLAWTLLLLASAFVLLTAHRWSTGGRRYRSTADTQHHDEGPLDAVDSWDELSHGADPTDTAR